MDNSLLSALEAGDSLLVDELASEMFITDTGQCNYSKIREFSLFSGAKVTVFEKGYFSPHIGTIAYKTKNYIWG